MKCSSYASYDRENKNDLSFNNVPSSHYINDKRGKKPGKDILALGNINTRSRQNKRSPLKALETNINPVNLMPYQQPIAMIFNWRYIFHLKRIYRLNQSIIMIHQRSVRSTRDHDRPLARNERIHGHRLVFHNRSKAQCLKITCHNFHLTWQCQLAFVDSADNSCFRRGEIIPIGIVVSLNLAHHEPSIVITCTRNLCCGRKWWEVGEYCTVSRGYNHSGTRTKPGSSNGRPLLKSDELYPSHRDFLDTACISQSLEIPSRHSEALTGRV